MGRSVLKALQARAAASGGIGMGVSLTLLRQGKGLFSIGKNNLNRISVNQAFRQRLSVCLPLPAGHGK
jgi:hypothetical protein